MTNIAVARGRLARGVSGLGVAAALLIAAPAVAQTSSNVQGSNAPAGAQVTLTDTNTGQSVTTTARADGSFTVVGLRPGTYTVTAGDVSEQVTIPVGLTVSVDLAPEAEADVAAGEEVVVRGRRNRVEVRTATVGTSISPEQLTNLPQNNRNFLNFAALAPGVSISTDPNNVQVQAGGVGAQNVNIFIDGTSQKNQVGFGGVAGQNFSQGNPFPQSAVQEFRVETQNFKAEYEQAGSAIITAITKTGGTEFHGGGFVEYMPKSFFGQPFFDREGEANNPGAPCPEDANRLCYREKPDFKRWQFGADLGGPIIPGVLHFYGAYEGTRQTSPALTVVLPAGTPPALVTQYGGSYPAEFQQDLYFGKLTLFVGDRNTFNASYFRRQEQDVRDFGGIRAPENGRDIGTASENYQLEWTHRADDWLNEMTFGRFKSFTGTPRVTNSPELLVTVNNQGGGELLYLGGNSFQQANDQDAWTLRNNFTYTGLDGHVIKAGARISFTNLSRLEDAFGLGQYQFAAPNFNGSLDNSIPYAARVSLLPARALEVENNQIGLFIQDDWEINEHFTANIGLRWDYETNPFNNNFVTPTRIANALRGYQPWQAAGIDADDYISTGDNRDPFKGAFQPRIGLSYDVNGDRDLVFFVGAGRYYDRNVYINAALETLFNTVRSDLAINFCGAAGLPACGSGPNQIQWNPAFRDPNALRSAIASTGLSGDVWVLNNDTPTPYTDQFNIGVRKQAGPVQLSAVVAHNRSYNGFVFVRGNRQANGNYTDGGDAWIRDPGAMSADMFLPGYTGRLNIGSSIGEARFTALYLTAEKPYSAADGWALTTSFTLSDAKSNQGRVFGESEMFNAGRQDAFGWQRTGGLERWRLVASGLVDLPWGLQFGAVGTFSSGPLFGNVRFDIKPPNCPGCAYFNEGGVFSPSELSDGFIGYANVDLRLAKTFRMPWGHDLTVEGEVFNVFDSVNRTYSTWGAGSGADAPRNENATTGRARSFQVGASYRF